MREQVYRFHKALNRPFGTTEEMMSYALSLVAQQIPADRLSLFRLDAARSEAASGDSEDVLVMELSQSGDTSLELDEEIHVTAGSPLRALIAEGGEGKAVTVSKPHPMLYAPLRGLGALRLERTRSRARPFSARERQAALWLAEELAQNLQQADLSHKGRDQLKRMEALTELAAIFATSLRVEDGLKLILQGIQRHFALDRVRLYLADRPARLLRGEMSVDIRGRVRSLRSEELPLETGAHRFADLVLGASSDPWIERFRHTVLHIPLTVQGQGIGLLVADNLISQSPIQDEDAGLLRSFAGQIALAVDNARLFDEVQELSLYDSLTRLPVRRYFQERLAEELYRAQRSGQTLALAVIDIDHFKGINDTYGHQIGDLVLREVGRVILGGLRKIDFPCRYGGDEIVLLLPQAGEEEACRIISRLAGLIKEARVPVSFSRAGQVGVASSIGVAVYPQDAKNGEELFQKADEALYWVKSRGRDGVASYAQKAKSQQEGQPA